MIYDVELTSFYSDNYNSEFLSFQFILKRTDSMELIRQMEL